MTALDATADGSPQLGGHAEEATAQAATVGPLAGDPATLGLPSFIVGSVALGLVLVGVVPPTAVGASLPIILAATSAGLFVATIWSAAIGQSAVASVLNHDAVCLVRSLKTKLMRTNLSAITSARMLAAHAFELVAVLLHIEKAPSIGVAFYPLLGLGVVDLRAIAHCALAAAVAFRRIGCHDSLQRVERIMNDLINPFDGQRKNAP